MTPEQVKLEFAHLALDKAAKDSTKEVFEDETYDEYEKETEAKDSRLSDIPVLGTEDYVPPVVIEKEEDEDAWEDVETYD